MKIGIVEILYHHGFLYSLASVSRESGAEVTVFTTKNVYDITSSLFKNKIKNYRWIIKDEDETIISFLKRIEEIANKEINLLFINTIQGNLCYKSIFFKPKCKTILVTGRATEWFGDKFKLISFNPKRLLNYNLRCIVRKRILPRYDAVLVHTEALKNYVLTNGYKKEIFVLPYIIYDDNIPLKKNGKELRFIVTGLIAKHRRDYDSILKVFEKMWKQGYKDVCLTILGRPVGRYGKGIVNQCRLLKREGFKIKFFDKFIPNDVFKREILSSDVIINPIKMETYLHGGFTSGLVEAIRYAKPGIYPVDYIVPKELLSSSLFYDRISKLDYLIEQKFLNNRGILEKLSKNAKENSEKYSLQQLTITFKDLCKKIFKE